MLDIEVLPLKETLNTENTYIQTNNLTKILLELTNTIANAFES